MTQIEIEMALKAAEAKLALVRKYAEYMKEDYWESKIVARIHVAEDLLDILSGTKTSD